MRPVVSTLNYGTGEAVPNGASVPLDADGGVCVFSLSSADLVVDVNGFYSTSGGGKFAAIEPARLLDTRTSGSALYRGAAIPALVGWYVFADYCSGQVRALQIADRAEVKQVELAKTGSVTAISEGPDGELFVLTSSGQIFAITPG